MHRTTVQLLVERRQTRLAQVLFHQRQSEPVVFDVAGRGLVVAPSSAVVPPPVFTQYTAMHMPFNHIPDVIQRHCTETWDPQGSSQGNEARPSPSPVRQRTWLPFHPQTASFGRRFVFCCLRTGWLGH